MSQGINDTDIRRLALIGARARLHELDAERDWLLATFPELAKESRKPRGPIAKAKEPAVLFDAEEHAPRKPAKEPTRRERRKHSPEFKAEAVDRLRRGDFLPDVARDLDLSPGLLKRWAEAARVRIKRMSAEEKVRRTQIGKRAAQEEG